ncbi:MAG: hypothetical protein JKY92_00985 [Magnetovibrio sp.]|nr:hypothetical protein [Magnetovibrio sp.]
MARDAGHEGWKWWSYDADKRIYFWQDLNDDGVDDVIMVFQHSSYCGTVGCDAYVFLSKDNASLASVGSITIDLNTVKAGKPLRSGTMTIYAKDECLLWAGERYTKVFSPSELLDGLDNWDPHACGSHYSSSYLKRNSDCQECHSLD